MRTSKVVVYVDIDAPRDDVFAIIANCDLRLQLSPLWGAATLEEMSPDFPQVGSHYRLRLVEGDESEYDTIVTTYEPNQKFAYYLTVDRQTKVSWTVQDVTQGTRLIYNEEFIAWESEGEEFDESVKQVVNTWLDSIKRYAELRDGRGHKIVRWFLDRYFLKLRADQRRVVVMILIFQAMGCISFILVAIALGIASLM